MTVQTAKLVGRDRRKADARTDCQACTLTLMALRFTILALFGLHTLVEAKPKLTYFGISGR